MQHVSEYGKAELKRIYELLTDDDKILEYKRNYERKERIKNKKADYGI